MAAWAWGKVAWLIPFLIILGMAGASAWERTMPGDFPDYGVPSATVYPVSDMGELAARLGSIATFDRRGNIVWYDDFEATLLKWSTTVSGAGSTVALDTTRANRGNQSVKLTSGAGLDFYALVSKLLSYPVVSRFGIEWSFSVESAAAPRGNLDFIVYPDSGTTYQAGIRFDPVNTRVQYYDSGGNWVTVTGISPGWAALNTPHAWQKVKLVVDLSTGEYVRLVVNKHVIDLSGIAMRNLGVTNTQSIEMRASLTSTVAVAEIAYVDDFILTQNEP